MNQATVVHEPHESKGKPVKAVKPAKAAKKEPIQKPEKIVQPKQNEVSRPKEGTSTGKIWAIVDHLSAAQGSPINRKPVMEACEKEGLNKATVATQYGRWRKFHGLVGTGVEKAAPAAPAAVVEPTPS